MDLACAKRSRHGASPAYAREAKRARRKKKQSDVSGAGNEVARGSLHCAGLGTVSEHVLRASVRALSVP
jgi:hypothetical protein